MNHTSLKLTVPRRAVRHVLLPAVVALAAAAVVPAGASAQAVVITPGSSDPVLNWYDATSAAVNTAKFPAAGNTQIAASRTWAIAWGAADEAIAGLPKTLSPAARQVATTAALATAVHDTVLYLIPGGAEGLNSALQTTLKPIPQSAAKRAGKAAGRKAAQAILKARKGDGLDPAAINIPFTPPAPALGVWRPTPPANAPAVQAGQAAAKPFLLPDVVKTFVAPAPPAIDSPTDIADLQEVDRLGGVNSTERTEEQTTIAKFWSQTSVAGYTAILRGVILGAGRPIAPRVHLIRVFHEVTADTQIAIYGSKYKYLRWRPVTALRTDDGNPATPLDKTFTPLIATPAHPEYPSGHAGYAGAAEQVFRWFIGPKPRTPITAPSTALPGIFRTYDDWATPTQENVDARVWSGIHLRSTDVASVAFGKSVASAALKAAAKEAAG